MLVLCAPDDSPLAMPVPTSTQCWNHLSTGEKSHRIADSYMDN